MMYDLQFRQLEFVVYQEDLLDGLFVPLAGALMFALQFQRLELRECVVGLLEPLSNLQ